MDKLDSLKENILIWYPFKKDTSILYLTSNDSEKVWEDYLIKISNNITIVKFNDKEKVKKSKENNVEIIEGKYNKIKIDEEFDYVILLGTLEYANEIIDENDSAHKLIEFAKSKTKNDGKVLLAVDNRLGVNYLVGNKSNHCEKIYDSTKNKFAKGKMYSRTELDSIIEKCNFKYKKFYYPLPNYKYPNVIYTDNKIPKKNDSKINYNVIYEDGSLILQDECALLKQFITEGVFTKFTNSYFVELSEVEEENKINYISFNNMRKDEYSLVLKIYNDKVEKYIKNEAAINHIQNIKQYANKLRNYGFEVAELDSDDNIVVEKLIDYPLLDVYITSLIKQQDIEKAYKIIDNWYNNLKEKLKPDEEGFVKDGFIDLVFENTFYNEKEEKFIIFDQEWYKENIPIDYILYRAIENMYAHNKNLNNYIPKEEMKERYNIIDKELYLELEQSLQKEVIDEERRKMYGKQYDYMISAEEVKKVLSETKQVFENNVELSKLVDELREENKRIAIEKSGFLGKIKSKLTNKNKK